MNWLLSAIADAAGGTLVGDDSSITGVSTDTRSVAAGQLFVALKGERFDAQDFLAQAVAAGAAALLVADAGRLPAGVPAVVVADTRLALGRLAAAWRAQFALPVIAVIEALRVDPDLDVPSLVAAVLEHRQAMWMAATRG